MAARTCTCKTTSRRTDRSAYTVFVHCHRGRDAALSSSPSSNFTNQSVTHTTPLPIGHQIYALRSACQEHLPQHNPCCPHPQFHLATCSFLRPPSNMPLFASTPPRASRVYLPTCSLPRPPRHVPIPTSNPLRASSRAYLRTCYFPRPPHHLLIPASNPPRASSCAYLPTCYTTATTLPRASSASTLPCAPAC